MKDPARSSNSGKKNIFGIILRIYPHITLILSAMFIGFWVLEHFNPTMGFLTSNISLGLMLAFFIISFIGSLFSIVVLTMEYDKKREDKEED